MAYVILPNPCSLSCMLNFCSAMPWVLAFMKCLQVSLSSLGTLSLSDADAKRIDCFVDGWNLTKSSFFWVFFSLWKMRVFAVWVFICSIAPACIAIDALSRFSMSSFPPAAVAPGLPGAGGAIANAGGGGQGKGHHEGVWVDMLVMT